MKIWLTGITSKGNDQHLREIIEPIKEYFDGFVWVFHDDHLDARTPDHTFDKGYNYLRELPKSKVILAPWRNRFDFSRNIGLYQGPIKYGDWFVTIDTMERMHVDFAKQLKNIINICDENLVNGAYLHNKHFMFQFNETTAFHNNPHCGVKGVRNGLEISSLNIWKDEYWRNVRDQYRGEFDFVDRNLRYYIYPHTNHLFLNCENDTDFVQERYVYRSSFINEILKLGIDIQDTASVMDFLKKGEYSEKITECISKEKYLNDFYRYHVLGRTDFKEDFDFKNLVKL